VQVINSSAYRPLSVFKHKKIIEMLKHDTSFDIDVYFCGCERKDWATVWALICLCKRNKGYGFGTISVGVGSIVIDGFKGSKGAMAPRTCKKTF